MTKKNKDGIAQKTGRPKMPITNGYQMNMEPEFEDRHEQDVEFAIEQHQEPKKRNDGNEMKRFNSNESKPNFVPRKSKRKS